MLLKSLRGSAQTITLESQSPTTSVHEIKSAYAKQAGVAADKLKLLYAKKPCADSKTLREIIGDDDADGDEDSGDKTVELSVMVIAGDGGGNQEKRGAPSTDEPSNAASSAAVGATKTEVLETEEFWEDLKGFLIQRLKDERQGQEVVTDFRKSWAGKR